MIAPRESFEPRRRKELREELLARARVWLPDWRPAADQQNDFVAALLDIAARLESEVTQRLDKVPEKTFRGFLHWLGVRGDASRAARLPVVFSLSAGAERVLAPAQVQLQATPVPADPSRPANPVTFETEASMMVTPGRLATVVAANPGGDAFFLPAEGFSKLEAPAPGPDTWQAVSDTPAGSRQLQLEPASGLDALPKLLHVGQKKQYRVTKADGNLVTIDPPLETPVAQDDPFRGSSVFEPFPEDGSERNRQEHALYIGSESVLNLPTASQVAIQELGQVGLEAEWSYWGKKGTAEDVGWQTLGKPTFANDRIVLAKTAGAVEITEIGGKKSRWLRALKAPGSVGETSRASKLTLLVNCDAKQPSCPPTSTERSPVVVEAIANTTPLVIDIPFLPLGREPKLFDTFYIGSPEAFSKKNASVRICLESLDATTAALAAVRVGPTGAIRFFGVGRDGQLHRLFGSFNTLPMIRLAPVRPPFTDNGIASVPAPAAALNHTGTTPVSAVAVSHATRGDRALVGVAAGNNGWIWSQHALPGASRWHLLGPIFDTTLGNLPAPDDKAQIILLLTASGVHVVGLNQGVLYETDLGVDWEVNPTPPTWTAVPVPAGREDGWRQLAPIFDTDVADPFKRWTGARFARGWIAVDALGVAVFEPDNTGPGSEYAKTLFNLGAVDTAVPPVAVRTVTDSQITVVVQQGVQPNAAVVAWSVNLDQETGTLPKTKVIGGFDWVVDTNDRLAFLFSKQAASSDQAQLATWFPRDPAAFDPDTAFLSSVITGVNGSPAAMWDRLVIPGTHGAVLSMPYSLSALTPVALNETAVQSALVIDSVSIPLNADDFVEATLAGAGAVLSRVPTAAEQNGPNRYWIPLPGGQLNKAFTSATIYNRTGTSALSGEVDNPTANATTVLLASGDFEARDDGFVVIAVGTAPPVLSLHKIDSTDSPTAPTEMTLEPAIANVADGNMVMYEYVTKGAEAPPSRILPVIDVRMQPGSAVTAIIESGAYVSTATPSPNPVLFAHPAGITPADSLVLDNEWTQRPTATGGMVSLVANAAYGALAVLAATKKGNPKLSWEYWDGQAWWKIKNLNDGTGHLQSTGAVTFCVPAGLQPTDVAGRTSHWIRARLVEGDYGKESVTIKSHTNTTTNVTTQTVERDLSGITPPQLASIDLTYKVCCAVMPDFVLTKDANAVRNQSEANRLAGATVEFFVPLVDTIHQAASTPSSAPASPEDQGPAIYLGFENEITDGPISVLFLVSEGTHDEAFPLRVDVLRETGFERIVADDGTRGLNESGVVTFNLAAPPPGVALLGSERRWLRLRPRQGFPGGDWRPRIRAAYLNGTWAAAAETQSLERLGSSDGSPGQRKVLARAPVIKDSLELRVREPLGDEEFDCLRQIDPALVREDLAYPGRWVLWTLVQDPDAAGKDERVYALDHETGEITFGDGARGMIPPIGADSILAHRYRKGGGDAANDVNAWGQVTLVTALSGVQTVAAPEGAAGGSDPQTPETVLRFAPANQLMRDRTLTLRDFEMQALQFSPDVAQAHAFQKGPTVHLVVVMAGRDPVPSQSVRRELARFLGSKAVPMLAAHGGIVIEPPDPVEVRIDLTLAIERIEHSAAVAPEARRRIAALLDPAAGGIDGTGWQLGDAPTETDIAAVLDDLDELEEIRDVTVLNTETGAALTSLDAKQLATLAPEGVTFRFRLLEEAEVGA